MRTSNLCPKCGHDEILFLPQLADRDDKDNVRPLVPGARILVGKRPKG